MQDTEVAQATSEVLDVLAARFGTTVAHLWDVLLRQAVAEGWVNFAWAVITAVGAVVALRVCLWGWRADAEGAKRGDFADYSIHIIVGGVATVLSASACAFTATDAFMRLMNPEFYALKFVLGAM